MGRETFPDYGWKVRLNHVFHERRNQRLKPKLKQIPPLIPLTFRYFMYFTATLRNGRKPLMDYMKMLDSKQMYGAPIGGIGGGTIGRGFKGEFCRFQIRPGMYKYHTIHANQFIVTIKDEMGETVYQKVLSPNSKPANGLSSWSWNFNGANARYCALYPRAWTIYDIPEYEIKLTCRQVSPIIPHNYKDSCIPGAAFIWTVENYGKTLKTVSITMTFKNGIGSKGDKAGGCWSELFKHENDNVTVSGVHIHDTIKKMPYTYTLGAKHKDGLTVTTLLRFDPCGKGKEIWGDLLKNGELPTCGSTSSNATSSGEQLASAVCVKMSVPASEKADAELALVWDMPCIQFTGRRKSYYKYYTKWFSNDGHAGSALCHYILTNYSRWEDEIDEWQKPILEDKGLPEWYKSAIFNELYFVADGGSVWLLADDESKLDQSDPRREYGHFAYLEGHEYRMYNTYDVHFYASFALAILWPKLQATLQYDFCDTICREDESRFKELYGGKTVNRKVKNSVPHDLGDPDEEPFLLINAYPIHDVSDWRDLNLKFVLQCFRDYQLTKDKNYLQAMWSNSRVVIERALEWDTDGDGLIENGGFPDQTYDSWVMKGPSAYCGSLWLAALYCISKMADIIGESGVAARYRAILEKAKQAFQEKLWNGQYYNFDSAGKSYSRSIMADQLCGHWYLKACGVTDEVFPPSNVKTTLSTIFNFNVMQFHNGTMGAVNGMMPDGKVDEITIQSEEVWTGVVYGLAAMMIHEGMYEEGFKTAEGIYNTVYNRIGLGFETPEALVGVKHYRSIGYMRPLSIWAMQHAWNQSKEVNGAKEVDKSA